jgi:two-component system cell cycle response regulator CtrA
MRIIILDLSKSLRSDRFVKASKQSSFLADVYGTPEEAITALKIYPHVAIVVIDPGTMFSSIDIIRRLRASSPKLPILCAQTLVDTPSDRIAAGADECLSIIDPVGVDLAIFRLRSLVRRYKGFPVSSVHIGNVEVRLSERSILIDGERRPITEREFLILECLMLNKGTPVSKAQICNQIYPEDEEPDPKNVDVFICKIRKRLNDVDDDRPLIQTVWGRGYMIPETVIRAM